MKKNIVIFFMFLGLFYSMSLFAQQAGAKYYEERLRPYKIIPIDGNGSYFFLNDRTGILDETDLVPLKTYYLQNDLRLGGYLDMGYLGIYLETFARSYYNNFGSLTYLANLNTYDRNNGYDEKNMVSWFNYDFVNDTEKSNAIFPNQIYPENFYIILQDISPFIPTIRIGKLWFDFDAYTLYRTWGLEGIQLKQDLPFYFIVPFDKNIKFEAGYNVFYSFNKVGGELNSTGSVIKTTLYDRTLLGGEYYLKSTELGTTLKFINLNYRVCDKIQTNSFVNEFLTANFSSNEAKIRDDFMYSLHLEQTLPYNFVFNGMYVLENHNEYKYNHFYTNQSAQRYELNNYNGVLNFGLGYRQVSVDFMPVNPNSWEKYPPFNADGYSWNYEEERNMLGNEKAYFAWFQKYILGIRAKVYYEFSQYYDEDNIYDWRKASLPGSKIKTELYYNLFGVEIYNRYYDYKGLIPNSDGSETSKILGFFENEIYYALTGSMSIDIKSDVYRKLKSDNTINHIYAWYIEYLYPVNSYLKIKAEAKVSTPQTIEPGWLSAAKDYIDQTSWGVDNYVKLWLEINF